MAVLFILLSTALAGPWILFLPNIGWDGQIRPSKPDCGEVSCGFRRRIGDESMTALASKDALLCHTIHDYITSSEKRGKLLLQEMDTHGSNHGELTVTAEEMADDVKKYCRVQEEESRAARRRNPAANSTGSFQRRNGKEDEDGFDQWYLDQMFKSASDRRRQENDELDKAWFHQCQGYALMTVNLLRNNFMMGAATMVATSSGSPKERIVGCGAVVNSVNAAIKSNKIPGVYIKKGEVMTERINIADLFVKTGALAVLAEGVFTLFSVCKSYGALALEA